MSIVAKQGDRFTETEIDDEIVVMHLGTGEFLALTGTAAAIWRLIDGRRDQSQIATVLCSQFDGKKAEINADVDGFIGKLKALGLIEIG